MKPIIPHELLIKPGDIELVIVIIPIIDIVHRVELVGQLCLAQAGN